jgi:hypothetical protein
VANGSIFGLDNERSTWRRSACGAAGNVEQEFAAHHMHYMLRLFWPHSENRPSTSPHGPRASEESFERRFRKPKLTFNKVFEDVTTSSDRIRKKMRANIVGKAGICSLVKVVTALKQVGKVSLYKMLT